MKIRKRLALCAMIGLLAGAVLAGCGSSDEAQDDNTVTVGLWANQLLENYAPWLQEQFPDVTFDFYVINNSTDYYKFRAENDELPDILTVRRFSLRDVEPLKEKLLDLSDTELANTFYQSYLRSYTYSDGTVNWLPACAEVDDLIVNKSLFEQYDIPLPTDYESFVYACREFEKVGIKGYATDFAMDYTCMETLQGFSIAQLSSAEGRDWRKEYESGNEDGLDEEVWLPVFERMEELIEDAGLDASDLELSSSEILNGFAAGEIAMYRGTGADLTSWGDDYEKVMMPYPGDTEEDSWYLTYPAFQVAASTDDDMSDERRQLILDIMTAMLSEDGLKHISEGKNMIAYNKDVTLELIDEFSNLPTYIEENRVYIRLASSDMFSISKDVVQRMLTGELSTAQEAYDDFDRQMRETDDTAAETAFTIETGYSHDFDAKKGNEAASAIYNSVREELGVDLMIGSAAVVPGDIPAGSYTEKEMSYILPWGDGKLLKMELTGDELYTLVQYMLDVKGSRDSVTNDSTLPCASGFEMTLAKSDNGYTVEKLTQNGAEIDRDATYSVVVSVTYEVNVRGYEEAGFADYEMLDATIKGLLKERLLGGEQLCEPTDYMTLESTK